MKLCFQKIGVFVIVFCLTFSLGFEVSEAQTNKEDPTAFWSTLAANAWNYFQPGVGVDTQTGLVLGSTGYPYITDWDNCLYIQAVLDAEKLGLISTNGTWGANDRINKVLTFLENRPLTANGVPVVAYSSITGKNTTSKVQFAVDAGALLVALKNLEIAKPYLKDRVDNIVYNLTNYEPLKIVVDSLIGEIPNGLREPVIYDYFVILGFACFWPQRFSAEADAMLDAYFSAPTINYNGVVLPAIKLTSEPLLMCNLYFQQQDSRLLNLTRQTYLAQEARYNMTNKYTAFSEGNSNNGFVYEWVSTSDANMWIIENMNSEATFREISDIPIAYLKVAVSNLALYNTPYTQDMVNFMLNQLPVPTSGYKTGIYENGDIVQAAPDDGNSIIISAARYAIEKQVNTKLTYPTPSELVTSTSVNQQGGPQNKDIDTAKTSKNLTVFNINQETDSKSERLPLISNTSKEAQAIITSVITPSRAIIYTTAGFALILIIISIAFKYKKNRKTNQHRYCWQYPLSYDT